MKWIRVAVRTLTNCLRLGLGLIEMLGEPSDFIGDASGNCGIEAGEILKRLMAELDVIA